MLCASLTACSLAEEEASLALAPTPHRLIDNLFVAAADGSATTSGMGGGAGRFVLEDRCLIIDTVDRRYSPVFRGREIQVDADGLTVAGRRIAYGRPVVLPFTAAGLQVRLPEGSPCPRDALSVREVRPE